MRKLFVWASALFLAVMGACSEIPQDVKVWDTNQVKYLLTKDSVKTWQRIARYENGQRVELDECLGQWELAFADTTDSKNKEVLSFRIKRSSLACDSLADTVVWAGSWAVNQANPLDDTDTLIFYTNRDTLKDTLVYQIESIRTEQLSLYQRIFQGEGIDSLEVREEYEILELDEK